MSAIGAGIGVAFMRQALNGGGQWTPDRLFVEGQDGYWPDGYAPPPFTPEALFGTTTDGYLAGGYAPDPFTPELLFGTTTAGYYAGTYEASQ